MDCLDRMALVKSTTLKMLTGMMKPTAGKIYLMENFWIGKIYQKIGALIENPPIYEKSFRQREFEGKTIIAWYR